MDIFQKAQKLKTEADQVLAELSLLKELRKLGKVSVVGSVALNLMVYKDIDIEVVVEKLEPQAISQVISRLTSSNLRRIDLSLINNSVESKEKFPKGIYLGIKYHLGMSWVSDFSKNEETWKVDIWFVEPENARSLKTTKEIELKLNNESRRIILEIKSDSYQNENYRKVFSALDIYKAVLDQGIVDTKGFQSYLKSRNS